MESDGGSGLFSYIYLVFTYVKYKGTLVCLESINNYVKRIDVERKPPGCKSYPLVGSGIMYRDIA